MPHLAALRPRHLSLQTASVLSAPRRHTAVLPARYICCSCGRGDLGRIVKLTATASVVTVPRQCLVKQAAGPSLRAAFRDDWLSVTCSVGFESYEASRQFADARAVSRLSPYLHFGQLSPRRVVAEAARRGGATVSKTFMRRLVWRDLAYWQLHHWPSMPRLPIRPQYAHQVAPFGPPLAPSFLGHMAKHAPVAVHIAWVPLFSLRLSRGGVSICMISGPGMGVSSPRVFPHATMIWARWEVWSPAAGAVLKRKKGRKPQLSSPALLSGARYFMENQFCSEGGGTERPGIQCVQEWRSDDAMLRAWQQGRTGFPLVDAGMRQLWQTGAPP